MLIYHSCKDNGTSPPNNTPDTTSHNFIWTIDTLGDGNSSVLYDIVVTADNEAWAVGQLYFKDTSGQFGSPYNIAKWNGQQWTPMRLEFPQYNVDCTVAFYSSALARSVFAVSSNNVLFTDGLSVARWNGLAFVHYTCLSLSQVSNGRFTKIWAASENDFYCAGTSGIIFHFNGSNWQKIESGTSLDVQDIWGSDNEILAVASKPFTSFDRKMLMISGSTASAVSDSGIREPLSCVWFSSGQHYSVAGSGIYEKQRLSDERWKNGPLDITSYYIFGMRGSGINDMMSVGGFGEVLHYNGVSWKSYRSKTGLTNGNYRAVAIKGNLVIAVGDDFEKAVVLRGTR